MSLCRNRNPDLEDLNEDSDKKTNEKQDSKGAPMELNQGSMRRTKKNKTRMPKDIIFNEEEEEILNQLKQKDSILQFDHDSDENKDASGKKGALIKDKDLNNDIAKNEEKEQKKINIMKVEIINTDMPPKKDKEWNLLSDKLLIK